MITMRSVLLVFTWILALIFFVRDVKSADAFVEFNGTDVVLGNSLFNATFCENATAKSLYKNGVNLLANIPKSLQTWCLDWNGETVYFTPTEITIVSNTSDKAHVVYIQEAFKGLIYIEFHFVVFPNVSGLYQYIKASNPYNETIDITEFRTVYRFDHELMPKITNIVRSGKTPDVSSRPIIQDTTWQLEDGSYWSKYDFCGYIRETPWFGVYGGGFGGWLITASREYHSGGPQKQELLVHQDSLMLNYFHSTHFGTSDLYVPTGWSKFYGPYLIYINSGSEKEVLADAAAQALIEQAQWPYSWVDDDEYPLCRGTVTGNVLGQLNATVVVYDSVDEQFDLQTLGYLYHTNTDENGTFTITNIRPGSYQILAYPLAGNGSDNLPSKNITVVAGETQDVGILNLTEPTGLLWNIGETNRRADGFRYSHELRNFYWHFFPPKNMTFTIGESDPSRDWYYAQREGTWNIEYTDTADGYSRELRLGIAAAAGSLIFNISIINLQVDINNCTIANFKYKNDKAIYRDALQSGNFYSEKLTIPADNVLTGTNVISLIISSGGIMYDAISLAIGSCS